MNTSQDYTDGWDAGYASGAWFNFPDILKALSLVALATCAVLFTVYNYDKPTLAKQETVIERTVYKRGYVNCKPDGTYEIGNMDYDMRNGNAQTVDFAMIAKAVCGGTGGAYTTGSGGVGTPTIGSYLGPIAPPGYGYGGVYSICPMGETCADIPQEPK